LETTFFPAIVWLKFHENPFSRSRQRLSGIFVTDGEKQKKEKKHL